MYPQTCLSLVADATPYVLARVFDLLARHGVVPSHCHTRLEPPRVLGGEPVMTIDLQLGGVDARLARRIATSLGAFVEVGDVLEGAKCGG